MKSVLNSLEFVACAGGLALVLLLSYSNDGVTPVSGEPNPNWFSSSLGSRVEEACQMLFQSSRPLKSNFSNSASAGVGFFNGCGARCGPLASLALRGPSESIRGFRED